MMTDLVGYTALTQKDEGAALRLLESHRSVLRPVFSQFGGREIKTIGDAFLLEFDSALDATQCAVEAQRTLHGAAQPDGEARLEIRIGIHVGDVVHRDGDVYGDAVNMVSRIEPLAEPGGVCISQTVYDQVRNKIDLPLRKLDRPQLKNVLFPLDVYAIDLPWVSSPSLASPWVGRRAELAAIDRAIDEAANGHRGVLLITGEEGVGKTRLLEEAARHALDRRFHVVRGRAVRTELATPYGPWSDAVRDYLRSAPNQLVYKVLGNYGNELVKLVPDLVERTGPLAPAAGGDSDQARLRFYEGVTQFFANIAHEAPVLIVLDDLQWADTASLRLLAYIVRGLKDHPVLLAAAFLAQEEGGESPVTELLRDARREHWGESFVLGRFTPQEVGELVGKMFGETEISDEFRQLLIERTGGNPFYLAETLGSLVEDGTIYRTSDGRWERKDVAEIQIPRSVREAVRGRFNRLEKGVQEALRVASVLGTTFSPEVLQVVSGLDEETVIRYLESGVEAHVLREEPGAGRLLTLSFTDPHVRDILYSEMLAIRRARYHRQAAAAIEALAQGRQSSVAAELAHHYREGHDAAKARDFSILAGDTALNLYAFAEAERQFQTALELLREVPDPALEAHVLDHLGRCHARSGRPDRAVTLWESAIRLYTRAGRNEAAAALCLMLADTVRLIPWAIEKGRERIETALTTARELLERGPPSKELALVYDMDAVWLVDLQEYDQARARLEQALEIARQLGDVRTEMELSDERWMVARRDEASQAIEWLRAKIEYFERPENLDPVQVMWAANNLSLALVQVTGDLAGALRSGQVSLERATSIRSVTDEQRARLANLIPVHLLRGELEAASREVEACRGLEGPGSAHFTIERTLARIELLRGDLEAAEHRARRLEEAIRDQAQLRARASALELLGSVLIAQGRYVEAVEPLRELLEFARRDANNASRAGTTLLASVLLAESLLGGPEPTRSLDEAEHLRRLADEIATALPAPAHRGHERRLAALIALAAGSREKATACMVASVEAFRRAGTLPDFGRALLELGRLYRAAGTQAPAELAFHEALELFRRCGMAGYASRAAAELEPESTPLSGAVRAEGVR